MVEEQDNPGREPLGKKGDSADSWAGLHQDVSLSSAYATLLDQYREALARIHVLEMQNQNLSNMVKWSPPPIHAQDGGTSTGGSEAAELAVRVEDVERLLANSVADSSERAATETSGSRDELSQLRIQVQSLFGQLSKVNGRHDETKRVRYRSDSGHSWRKWSNNRSSWLNRILKR